MGQYQNTPTKTAYLDCSHEVSPLQNPPTGRLCWLAGDITPQDWLVELPDTAMEEIHALARLIEDNPLQMLQRRVHDHRLPALSEIMARMKFILDQGVGFAVLNRLPMDEFSIDTLIEVYWMLGQYVGRPVAQKWNGQMIYDVTDTGQAYAYGVRGSHTAVELNFHTDNAFARQVPDYVGLLCQHPARRGGVSRFCSLYSVHQRLQTHFPEALERLYQPMFFDRQKEHRDGAPPVCLAPFFSWRGERLFARANASLIRKGYEIAGQPMDVALSDALSALNEVCAAPELWYEAPLQRGQIQYLNNHEIGHYRSAFEDHADPAKKRHLYRLWHRETGSPSYDGL